MSGSLAPLRHAVVIAVGSELLTPHKLDTNSLFLTERLNALGVAVRYKSVVGDDPQEIAAAVRQAVAHAELIILTGGLGPTEDDVTRDAVASAFGLALREDPTVLASIRSRFESRRVEMPSINRRQALVPDGAVVLSNANGTAPGLWLEQPDGACLLLPGPPRELRPMFERAASRYIAERAEGQRVFRRVLTVVGHTESHVESLTQPVYSQWRPPRTPISTTILASPGQVELHLSTREAESASVHHALDEATAELSAVLGSSLVSTDGASLEAVVGRLLSARGCAVAVAESCTGGLTAYRLTGVPGASAYVRAGWVTYSNQAKTDLLGVDPAVIEEYGAVSEPVAAAMAVGARERGGEGYGLGITGVAGPGGGSLEKPVGTVCVALAGIDAEVRIRTFRFPGERETVRFQASQAALDMLRRDLVRQG